MFLQICESSIEQQKYYYFLDVFHSFSAQFLPLTVSRGLLLAVFIIAY